jgi:hypothetical protein
MADAQTINTSIVVAFDKGTCENSMLDHRIIQTLAIFSVLSFYREHIRLQSGTGLAVVPLLSTVGATTIFTCCFTLVLFVIIRYNCIVVISITFA